LNEAFAGYKNFDVVKKYHLEINLFFDTAYGWLILFLVCKIFPTTALPQQFFVKSFQ